MTNRNKYERGDKIAFQKKREKKIVCLGIRKISQYRSIVLRNVCEDLILMNVKHKKYYRETFEINLPS